MNGKAERLLAAFDHLPAGAVIVEIGCVRTSQEVPSDGYSTVYLAEAAQEKDWAFYSIDSDPAAVANARTLTEDLPVSVQQADGATWLAGFVIPISGLYLDGAADAAQAVDQYDAASLADDAMIVIDDIQPIHEDHHDPLERGKGDLLLDVLEADGWSVEIHETEPDYLMAVATR